MSWQGELFRSITKGDSVEQVGKLVAERSEMTYLNVAITETCSCLNKLEMGFPFEPSVHAMSSAMAMVESGVCPHAQQAMSEGMLSPDGWQGKTSVLSPLFIAAIHGRSHLVDFFVRQGYTVNEPSSKRFRTPLHVAAMSYNIFGGPECVRLLLEANADKDAKDYQSNTPLMLATRQKNEATVQMLVDAAADVNLENTIKETALHIGTSVGTVECVRILIQASANPNVKTGEDFTPLFMAVRRSSVELVEAILKSPAGCDVNLYYSERQKTTPLLLATFHGNDQIVKLLLEYGADPNLCNPEVVTPLIAAAYSNHYQIAEAIIAHGAEINTVNSHGYSALHHAAWEGDVQIVELLLRAGAHPDTQTNDKNTPLSLACHGNHHDTLEKLVQAGCCVNNVDKDRDTPLLYTTFNGSYQSSGLLVGQGADPDLENTEDCTPLWNAVYSNSPETVELLLKANVRISVPSRGIDQHAQTENATPLYPDKRSPLFVACLRGLYTIAKILVLAGTNLQRERWFYAGTLPPAVTDNQDFHRWLTAEATNPPSLKRISRAYLRETYGKALVEFAPQLELPHTLCSYLLLHRL